MLPRRPALHDPAAAQRVPPPRQEAEAPLPPRDVAMNTSNSSSDYCKTIRLPHVTMASARLLGLALVLHTFAGSLAGVKAQLLSADFTQCLQAAAQAPDNQKLVINNVFAQLDTGRESGGSDGDNTDHQSWLRLVAFGETGSQSDGFSNETNYLGELCHCSVIAYRNSSLLYSSRPVALLHSHTCSGDLDPILCAAFKSDFALFKHHYSCRTN